MTTESPSERKRLGRPPTGGPLKRPVTIMLDERISDGLRLFGDGNLSAGVALAVGKARGRAAARAGVLPDVRAKLAEGRPSPAKRTRKKAGRPMAGLARRMKTTIQLYPAILEELLVFGDGVVSQGIERVALLVGAAEL